MPTCPAASYTKVRCHTGHRFVFSNPYIIAISRFRFTHVGPRTTINCTINCSAGPFCSKKKSSHTPRKSKAEHIFPPDRREVFSNYSSLSFSHLLVRTVTPVNGGFCGSLFIPSLLRSDPTNTASDNFFHELVFSEPDSLTRCYVRMIQQYAKEIHVTVGSLRGGLLMEIEDFEEVIQTISEYVCHVFSQKYLVLLGYRL